MMVLESLQNYTLMEIVTLIVLIALSIRGVVSFVDWGMEKLKQIFEKENNIKQSEEKINKYIEQNNTKIEELNQNYNLIIEEIKALKTSMQSLIESDKDDIKSWITSQHHYFCYELKHIDDYSLDCLEKRYAHYKAEGGNSFVEDLMEEMRNLPKVSVYSQQLQDRKEKENN